MVSTPYFLPYQERFYIKQDIPCVLIKKSGQDFAIISIYIDDLNIIGIEKACKDAATTLCLEFEKKDFGPKSFCIGLQITQVPGGLLHQTIYAENVMK